MTGRAWRDGLSTTPTLVGRDATLQRLGQLIDLGSGALVVGPPGVGVSALLVAVTRAQRATGRTVHHEVGDDVGPVLADNPTVVDGTAWAPAPAAVPLIVIDDAHRLAEGTAVDLRRRLLAGQARCLLGTTALDRVPPALDWLWQSGTLERLDLDPLSSDDMASWVTALVGAPPDPPTVEALRFDNGGLPGLAVDTLHALVEGHDADGARHRGASPRAWRCGPGTPGSPANCRAPQPSATASAARWPGSPTTSAMPCSPCA